MEPLEPRLLLDSVIINEIHYDPAIETDLAEFVELYNTTDTNIDISHWRVSDGIDFEFPEATILPAHGYVVVAQDPATILSKFGAAAFGPFIGRLENDGERIVLRDEAGVKVDEVDYRSEFPWPIASHGDGPSMELIHPSLDNDLGGSWRASETLIPDGADWMYFKGVTEPSEVPGQWREIDFPEPEPYWNHATLAIGYSDEVEEQAFIETELPDMMNGYTTVYLRKEFTVANPAAVTALELHTQYDDGINVWINDTHVCGLNVRTPGLAYDGRASTEIDNREFIINFLSDPAPSSYLVAGTNVMAVQLLNASLGSSDAFFDALLRPAWAGDDTATPGLQNSVYSTEAPPQVRQVQHAPQQPASGEPFVVTAKITDPDGVAEVQLIYQLVLPGDYIPAYLPLPHDTLLADPNRALDPNPAFENPANWTVVVMIDDGTGSDALAGDNVYTAVIPAQGNRTLVRYRITAADTAGASVTVPYPDDPSLNFACYVYDGVLDYVAETSVLGDGHVYDSETLTSLPVYSLIARAEDITEMMAYDSDDQIPQTSDQAARRAYNWEGAFVYDGVVYDHVAMRLRGANGRYHLAGKRSMRLRFNRGHYLQARDQNGDAYPTKWQQLVVGKMFGNRLDGNFGLSETINNEFWRLVGVPAPYTHWFHFRVVDGAEEAPAGVNGQYYGDFWGMFLAFEPYDVRFLEAHDLPKGNLYKLTNQIDDGELQQRYQAPDAVSNAEDYNNIRDNLGPSQSEQWLYANVNYDEWYRYHAVAEAIKHYDYWPTVTKNMTWYFEPDDDNPLGCLWYLPFDSDASWGPTWNAGNDRAKNAIYGGGQTAMQIEYRNVIREIRDLIFQPEVIEPWIDRAAQIIADFSPADRDRWKDAPSDAGYQDFGTLEWKVQDMKNFAFVGGDWPGGSVGAGGQAAYLDQLANDGGDAAGIPYTPTLASTSPLGFPIDSLTFASSSFNDPQGSNTFAAMEWRIGEITDPAAPAYDPDAPYKFEYTAQWESGEITTFNASIHIPGGALEVGHTYRVRVRMKDTSGRWSHWSDTIQLTTGQPVSPVPDGLRINRDHVQPGRARRDARQPRAALHQ